MSAPSHPVATTMARDILAAQFIRVTQDSLPDPNWHFQTVLPKTAQGGARGAAAPAADGQLISLGFFHIPQPPADVEVYGALLSYELDPADFLDFWMEKNGLTALSRSRVAMIGGSIGDAVVSWPAEGTFLGRCFCLKFGPRLMLVWCRCAKADYEALAETFFVAISNFRLTQDPFGPLAQNIHWVSNAIPSPWKLALPHNWVVQNDPPIPRISSFQAVWKDENAVPLAKFFCALVPPDLAATSEDALARVHQAVTEAGITIGATTTSAEPAAKGIIGSWHSVSRAQIQDVTAELRCRVQLRDKLWFISAVLTPPRDAPAIWMHAKRTLDFAAQSLEVTP